MAEYKSAYTGTQIDQGIAKANEAYVKPSGGIPKTDLASAVQTSLGKADTAIQDISGKQDTLVSGTNIKTINNTSILGSGNIEIGEGGTSTDVKINGTSITSEGEADIKTQGTYNASSNKIATMSDLPDISTKQDTLVSGTNIKTINSTSILGSGNIEVGGGSSPVAVDDIQNANFTIADENGKVALAIVEGGHLRTRKFNSKDLANSKRSVKILFIGNSLTQDAVSYLPLLLDEIAPEINYTIYDYYDAGLKLSQQYTNFVNETPCAIFGTITNNQTGGWNCQNNSVSMKDVCDNLDFDIVVIQEYSYYTVADADEITDYNNVVNYISSNYNKPFRVFSLIDAPARGTNMSTTYTRAKNYAALQYKNTVCEGFMNPGGAIYHACDDDLLKDLGDQGGLSPDGTHAQEGLPCMLEAYVLAMWLFNLMGIPKSVYNSQARMTATLYSNWQTIGANLGTGVVEGTDAQYLEAQRVAIETYKYTEKLFNDTVDSLVES